MLAINFCRTDLRPSCCMPLDGAARLNWDNDNHSIMQQAAEFIMDHSVTGWIADLKSGSDEAVEKVVARYYDPIVRLVGKRLSARVRRSRDEEDIALSAFDSFVRRAREGGFAQLEDRNDLWRLLVTISFRKAAKHAVREMAEKRGGGGVMGESAFAKTDRGGIDELAASDAPAPEEDLECEEMALQILAFLDGLEDPMQRDVALWTAQGMTAAQLAKHLNCAPRTVERKLKRLREKAKKWADEND